MRNDDGTADTTDSNIDRDVSNRQTQTHSYRFVHQMILALSLVGMFLAPVQAQADALPDEDPPVPVDQAVISSLKPDQILVYVRGMVCGMCVQGITKLLTKVPGVKKVEIDLETGAVLIRVSENESPTDPQIKEAIKGAGYEAQDIFRSTPPTQEAGADSSSPTTNDKVSAKKKEAEKKNAVKQSPSTKELPAAKSGINK